MSDEERVELERLKTLPLSDLLLKEEALHSEIEHNDLLTGQLLDRFYKQWSTLQDKRARALKQLDIVQRHAKEKSRLAQLLQFPPDLARWTHLVAPSSCGDGSDPKLLVTFGPRSAVNASVSKYIATLAKAMQSRDQTLCQRGVSLLSISDSASGMSIRARGSLKSMDSLEFSPGAASTGSGRTLLAGHQQWGPDSVSPHKPPTAEDLTMFERAKDQMPDTASRPRLEKMAQPFALADAAYIPYLQKYDETMIDDRIKNRAHRYLRRFTGGDWVAHGGEAHGVDLQTMSLRLKRAALIEFPVMRCRRAGRVLLSVRPHALGELLFVDLAILSVSDNPKDLLLSAELRQGLDRIEKKSELFEKFPSWDMRLVHVVFAYLIQQATPAPVTRRPRRSSSSHMSMANFFEKKELQRKLKELCCPIDDIEPTLLNELYKLAQLISASLPSEYRREDDDLSLGEKSFEQESVVTVSPDEIVRLMIIFQCNCIVHASGSTGARGTLPHPGGRSLFFLASLMQHSCVPNCAVVHPHGLVDAETGAVEAHVRAIRPIRPAERMSICYLALYQPAAHARRKLRERYFFECHCPRCSGDVEDTVRTLLYVDGDGDGHTMYSIVPFGVGGFWRRTTLTGLVGSDKEPQQQLRYDDPIVLAAVSLESRLEGSSGLANLWKKMTTEEDQDEDLSNLALEADNELSRLQRLLSVALTLPRARLAETLEIVASSVTGAVGQPLAAGAHPTATQYTIALSVMILFRVAEALATLLKSKDITQIEGSLAPLRRIFEFGVRYLAHLGYAFGVDEIKTSASGAAAVVFDSERSLEMMHHLPFLASMWEGLSGLGSRLLALGAAKESVASECWETVFSLYRHALQWTDTARCVKAQLFAAEPLRYCGDGDTRNAFRYLPPHF